VPTGNRPRNFLFLKIDGDNAGLAALAAKRVCLATYDRDAGNAVTESFHRPKKFRAALGPYFEQASFQRNAIAMLAAPLRPARGGLRRRVSGRRRRALCRRSRENDGDRKMRKMQRLGKRSFIEVRIYKEERRVAANHSQDFARLRR